MLFLVSFLFCLGLLGSFLFALAFVCSLAYFVMLSFLGGCNRDEAVIWGCREVNRGGMHGVKDSTKKLKKKKNEQPKQNNNIKWLACKLHIFWSLLLLSTAEITSLGCYILLYAGAGHQGTRLRSSCLCSQRLLTVSSSRAPTPSWKYISVLIGFHN